MYLIFDTETTGLPKDEFAPLSDFDNWPRLVQIAWQLHDNKGKLLEAQNFIVKPKGFVIPYNAEKVHGISTQRATEEGKSLIDVLTAFTHALQKTKLIVGHNIQFDLNIMGAEFLRSPLIPKGGNQKSSLSGEDVSGAFPLSFGEGWGEASPPPGAGGIWGGIKWLDTKTEATNFVAIPGGKGGKFKWLTLTELHQKLFGESFEDAHDAAYDVRATARCFFGLLQHKVVPTLDGTVVEEVVYEPPVLDEANFAKKKKETPPKSSAFGEDLTPSPPLGDGGLDLPFTHLHVHSQFSLLQSTASVKYIIKKVKESGMSAVAITDFGNMHAAFNATAYAADEGIKMIVGCEVFISEERKRNQFTKGQGDKRTLAVLLAKHKEGYKNLSKLCSLGYIEGLYANYPRVDKDLIQQYSAGVIALIGGFESEIYNKILEEGEESAERALQWWIEVFKDDLYLEISRHGLDAQNYVNSVLIRLGKKYKIKCVATNNVFYLDKKDADAHDTLLAVRDGKAKKDEKWFEGGLTDYIRGKRRFGFPNEEFYFKSSEEMNRLFADLPEAIEATQEIVDKCEAYKLKSNILMPKYEIPPEFADQDDYLRYLAFEGAKRHYGEPLRQDVIDRLDLELNVIKNMGFPGYFLIVQDFINAGRKMGVFVGPGRGCLTGDTPVILKDGTSKRLDQIKIGDEVITIDGSIQNVQNTFKYKVEEELVNIKTYYGDVIGVTLTKDHKVFAEKQLRPYYKWALATQKARKMPEPSGKLEWIPAEKIEIGDWLFIPKPKVEIKETLLFDLAEFSNEGNLYHDEVFVYHDVLNPLCNTIQKTKKANRFIYLDAEWYQIFGLFVGDGWMRKDERPTVSFVFANNDSKGLEFVRNKMLTNGFEVSIGKEHRGCIQLHINNKHLHLLFQKLFGEYQFTSATKYIPDFILTASEENVAHFLKGYNWADGHEDKHKYRFTTVSRKLADQLRFLCWRIGVPASLGSDNRIETREEFKNAQIAYYVTIPKDERIGAKQAEKNYFYKPVENGILVKVREVSVIPPPGGSGLLVYDIEVNRNANYLTSSFLVHNSAAGSVVAYCIGITNIDPIQYSLLFERFLNPERVSMPDIDIDFDDAGRQSVIDYVINKYGKNQVAQIITYGTMAAKMAIKDVARALELELAVSNQLAKYVPEKPGTKLKDAFAEVIELREILTQKDDPRQKVLQDALTLEGSVRGTGIHAAGVIIAPQDLLDCIPVCTAKDSDLWVTQFDGKVIESAGMLKMDFLGLKTLTIIKDALELIKQNKGISIDIDKIPLDDLKTFELYQRGDTIGTFQFESEGMQMYLRQLKPTDIEDLIAMNSLYRPGPLAFIPLYIDRKHGREAVEYPHPLLEPILSKTFGIMVYQEQIMQTAQIMAGYSLGGADLLRRAMGKKDKAEMDRQRQTFVKGAKETHNIPEAKANEVFDIMAKFAEYGFNRSHSAAYSVVAYQTAYLKANYPAEYMAAVLSHNMNIEKITFFLEECQKMGVQVLGPDVNESETGFSVNQKDQVRFGLAAIKGTGETAVENIISERKNKGKFKNIFDFARRLNLRTVNKKSFESLAQAGAFDSFGLDRATYFHTGQDGIPFIEKLLKYGAAYQKDAESSQNSLFGGGEQAQIATPTIPKGEPWSKLEQLNREKEVVGFYISGHPLDQFKSAMKTMKFCTIDQLEKFDRQEVKIAGIITSKVVRQGQRGAFTIFTVEDYRTSMEIPLFNQDHETFSDSIKEGDLVIIKGKVQRSYRGDKWEIRINDIQDLAELGEKLCRGLWIEMDVSQLTKALIENLENILEQYEGNHELKIKIKDSKTNYHTELTSKKFKIRIEDMLERQLEKLNLKTVRIYQ